VGYRVVSLGAGQLDAFLDFFDRVAFTDNPGWADCYCLFYHHSSPEWDERSGAQNRVKAAELIRQGAMSGFLAFDRDRPVGWCNANLRSRFQRLTEDPDLRAEGTDERVLAVVCFVVAPGERRRGVARQLLAAACAAATAQGLDWVEAYPRKDAQTPAQHYHGPLALYQSEGFVICEERRDFWIVRRDPRARG
jgi:ribosomal protein S18 acetylase RimI-like enzyme